MKDTFSGPKSLLRYVQDWGNKASMLVVDHRTAPEPTYTAHSPLSAVNASTLRSFSKSPTRTLIAPLASSPTNAAYPKDKSSVLFPAEGFKEVVPHVRAIQASQVAHALCEQSVTRLPEAEQMFPWLHGIRDSNAEQMAYFKCQPAGCPPPSCYRGVTLVHVNNATQTIESAGRLVGSVPHTVLVNDGLANSKNMNSFKDPVHSKGVQLRAFNIQARKIALLSDIIVYDPKRETDDPDTALLIAGKISEAQRTYRQQHLEHLPEYNTFVVSDPFEVFERHFPHLVATENDGTNTGYDPDFHKLEQEQMRVMSKASEISNNVFLGNTDDWTDDSTYYDNGDPAPEQFQIHIRCEDAAGIPSIRNNDIQDSGDPEHVVS